MISGLLALQQIFQANEFAIDEERGPLNHLVEYFFPLLEQVMSEVASSASPNQLLVMHLISKIFFSANNVSDLKTHQTRRVSLPRLISEFFPR